MTAEPHRPSNYYFTFWKLVRSHDTDELTYIAQPYITIYPTAQLIEINTHPSPPSST